MGAKSSKNSTTRKESSHVNGYASGGGKLSQRELELLMLQNKVASSQTQKSTAKATQETTEKKEHISILEVGVTGYSGNEDDFYDGIPRFLWGLIPKFSIIEFQAGCSSNDDEPVVVKANLKSLRKQVKKLKKKSLWSRSMEEVMEKLVGLVVYLNQEIQSAFCCAYDNAASIGSLSIQQKLGPAGLALHYANIVLQIDSVVARSSYITSSAKDALYQSLPPNIKSSLRAKIHSFSFEEEFSITEIKAEMEKTLCWLAPIASNTAKAHHGFGWVGEWANTGSDWNRKPLGDVAQIETLNYADKERTEACILELVLWLNHLIRKSKEIANGGGLSSTNVLLI